jgi:hypothetical protein
MRIDKETPRRHAAASDALLNAFASYIILDLTKGGATRYSRSLNRIEEARLESGILNYRIRNTEAERGMGKAHDSDRKIRVTP